MKLLLIIFAFFYCTFSLFAIEDTESIMKDGHHVYVPKNVDESTFWKCELLKQANKSIEMSCGYCGGKVFSNVYSILKEQLEKNPDIQIRLMISQNAGLFTEENQKLLEELAAWYPENFDYVITGMRCQVAANGLYTTENHMKLIIVDEKYFLLGGTNLVDNLSVSEIPLNYLPETLQERFLPKASCDQDVVVSGPMAKKLREEFFQIFALYKSEESILVKNEPFYTQESGYQEIPEFLKGTIDLFDNHEFLIKNVKAYAVISGPRFQYHQIGDLYEYFLKGAQKSLEMGHMYFFPVERIYDLLIDAAKRDLEICLITNGLHLKTERANSTVDLYAYLNRVNYLPILLGQTFRFWQRKDTDQLIPKQTSIYEYNKDYVLYHKKVLIIDNKLSTLGSYNLGKKSEHSDFEVNIFIDSEQVADNLHEILAKDISDSRKVSLVDAIDYHFSVYYNVMKKVEDTFFDGTILGKNPPKKSKPFPLIPNK